MGTYTWMKCPVPEDLSVRQVYGIAFSNDGRILLRIEDGKYKLTGGRPESGETFEETLLREYVEELNVNLVEAHYLGYLLVEEDGNKYAQVRMIARIKDILENHIDIVTGKEYGRKLVASDRVKEYLNYSDVAGNQMLEEAMELAKSHYGLANSFDEMSTKSLYGLDDGFDEINNDLILIEPSEYMEELALDYKKEHFAFGDMQVHGSGGLAFYDDYRDWLKHIDSIRTPSSQRPIKTSTFFSKRVSDGKLIGCIKIHNSLTDELKNGGHIAYGIRPSERGKGYGKKQLQLGLAYAKHLRMDHVIITCGRDNAASASTAISCGGVLVKEFEEDGIIKQHYQIELKR